MQSIFSIYTNGVKNFLTYSSDFYGYVSFKWKYVMLRRVVQLRVLKSSDKYFSKTKANLLDHILQFMNFERFDPWENLQRVKVRKSSILLERAFHGSVIFCSDDNVIGLIFIDSFDYFIIKLVWNCHTIGVQHRPYCYQSMFRSCLRIFPGISGPTVQVFCISATHER